MSAMASTGTTYDAVIRTALEDAGLTYQRTAAAAYLVTLPGEHKLATMCWLVAGDHALLVEAFVMRAPDENREQLWDFLLQRNARLFGVGFSIDANGDVYLVGRLPLAAVASKAIDDVLGAVLAASDDNFDRMLQIGFGSSIRREWAWRVSRGESTANLRAFAHFADPDRARGTSATERRIEPVSPDPASG